LADSHWIIDEKVYVYRRERSPYWQCAVYLSGRNRRRSTGQENIALATEFARDWYQDQLAEDRMARKGLLAPKLDEHQGVNKLPRGKVGEKRFSEAAEAFLLEWAALTEGERNADYIASKEIALRLYLLPFFAGYPLSTISAGRVQAYRMSRNTPPEAPPAPTPTLRRRKGERVPRAWRRPSRSSLRKEIVCLRQVLKTAQRHGWLDALPDLSEPFRKSAKVSHRAWFSPTEYTTLWEQTRDWAKSPPDGADKATYEQLHDYVLFMGNTGLRPDEARQLQFRDVTIVLDVETNQRILEIEVRGKRGVGWCKSMPGAVHPFERLRERTKGKSTDPVFGKMRPEPLNRVLVELDLKIDREGQRRTAYSLRHTYICLRLIQGADIYQVAKNCRTSVEMIEKYYASHIKDVLHAATINVRKPSRVRKGPSAKKPLANAERP
jgi:integrase